MRNGKNRRPGRGGPPHERRALPPEFTGNEARHLEQLKKSKAPLVVELTNGERIEGVVEYFDREKIKINRSSGPNLFLRKSEIRFLQDPAD